MKTLEVLLNELQANIPKYEMANLSISESPVGWHIEHSLLTMNVVINALKQSDPSLYKWTFNWKRILVYTTGKIPRGRVKAPKVVRPTVTYNADTLMEHVSHTKANLEGLSDLEPNYYFKHPFFGDLNVKPTVRFLQIHTLHHLHIINDIVNSNK
jgi:hypothetical protein